MKHKKTSETYSSNSKSDSYQKDSNSISSDSSSSNDLYEAEEILAKKWKHGKVLYKVKWKDYPINQSTWEPLSNFNNSSLKLIHKFEKAQKEKSKNNSQKGKKNSDGIKDEKRFSKRKVLSKKYVRPVEEILIEDSDSDSDEKTKKSSKKKNGRIDEDSSIDSDELSPASSDSNEKKRNHFVHENDKNKNITHRAKNFVFKSRSGDIKHDKVKRIISGKITDPKNFQLNCLVEFEKRPDGHTPDPKNFSSDVLRIHAPQCLIDFYQSRISINKKCSP